MERCIAAFSGRSTERGQTYSFDDVYEKLSGNGAEPLFIVFSSDFDNFMQYTDLFREKFPESQVIGTTSFFNYTADGGTELGLSALAVYSGIECAGGVLEEAGRCPILHISAAKDAVSSLGLGESDAGKMCCLEFTTAYGKCEELVLDTLAKASGELNIPVIGCTAGVRKGTERSYVSLNGKVYTDSCVFMYIRDLNGRISIIRENAYKHTEHFFQATSVDCENSIVYEFNNRPAAVWLSSVVGADIPVLAQNAARHPIGRLHGDNIYVTSVKSIRPDMSVQFFSGIYNYSRVVLLEPDDAGAVIDRFMNRINGLDYIPSFSFAVNCAFDHDVFGSKGADDKLRSKLAGAVGVYSGVSGCGEQTDYMNVNKTLLIAAFE